jgi:hypothetical protein
MANGDLTKEIEYDKIEVVNTWNIQVRKATKVMEEQADGSKKELNRLFHRHVLVPFNSSNSLLNKTREEYAKRDDVKEDMHTVMDALQRLEDKLDKILIGK